MSPADLNHREPGEATADTWDSLSIVGHHEMTQRGLDLLCVLICAVSIKLTSRGVKRLKGSKSQVPSRYDIDSLYSCTVFADITNSATIRFPFDSVQGPVIDMR